MIFSECICFFSYPKQKSQCAIAFYSILLLLDSFVLWTRWAAWKCLSVHDLWSLAKSNPKTSGCCKRYLWNPSQPKPSPSVKNVPIASGKGPFQTPKKPVLTATLLSGQEQPLNIHETLLTSQRTSLPSTVGLDEWRIACSLVTADQQVWILVVILSFSCFCVCFSFFLLIGWWDFSMQTREPILVHSQQKLLLLLALLLLLLMLLLLLLMFLLLLLLAFPLQLRSFSS